MEILESGRPLATTSHAVRRRALERHGVVAEAAPAIWVALGFSAHVPLALLMSRLPVVGTVHALASLAVGLAWAVSPRHPWRVSYVVAYISGAEVLWRMTGASVYWEFAKYSVALVLLVAAWRMGRRDGSALAMAYFALLMPAAVITMEKNPFGIAVNNLSFNLSGPLAIMASVLFFSRLRISLTRFRRLLLVAVAPIVGASVIVWKGAQQTTNLAFGGSNVALSGGFAPNQVSATLGLGVLLLALFLLSGRAGALIDVALFALLLVFATQSAMTFSRGGLYLAGISLAVASVVLLRDKQVRRRLVLGAVLVVAAASFVIVPQLLSFTGGAIASRFAETSTTGRVEIVKADLDTFLGAPVFGVGPGQGKQSRGRFFRSEASHTEFTRLLAEHGLFGLAAMGCLIALAGMALRAPAPPLSFALRASLLTWSLVFMSIDGVRLVAPCLAFGISLVTLVGVPGPARRIPGGGGAFHGAAAGVRKLPAPRGRQARIAEEADEAPW